MSDRPTDEELANYIQEAEQDGCSEYHAGTWPDCDSDAHLVGKDLLRRFGVEPRHIPWDWECTCYDRTEEPCPVHGEDKVPC